MTIDDAAALNSGEVHDGDVLATTHDSDGPDGSRSNSVVPPDDSSPDTEHNARHALRGKQKGKQRAEPPADKGVRVKEEAQPVMLHLGEPAFNLVRRPPRPPRQC